MAVVYKVVEISAVSDETIEAELNEWTARGWCFDSLHFAMRESSKRPAMAFLTFTRGTDREPAVASDSAGGEEEVRSRK